jgi:hypothetical protein
MLKKRPQGDPSAAYLRKAIAERWTGDRKCACGEDRPEALIRKSDPAECHKCQRKRTGKTTFDNHHPAGEANNPTTTPIPVNDHCADLNVAQRAWPKQTLDNPEGSPLLARAACIRGYMDTNDYLIDKLVQPDPEFYELLDAFLTVKFGTKWWVNTPLEKFAPERQDHLPNNPNPTNNLPPEDSKIENDVSAPNPDEKLAA